MVIIIEDCVANRRVQHEYIKALLPSEKNKEKTTLLGNIEAAIVKAINLDPHGDIDEVPPHFQYPPGAITSDKILHEKYVFCPEIHLS